MIIPPELNASGEFSTDKDWSVVDATDPDEADDKFEPNEDQHPAAITIRATSTSNPARPRTIRAGYEYSTGTLTVIFRDGTWWNYYGVNVDMWNDFRVAPSKGRYLIDSGLNNWPKMGPPSMGQMSDAYVRALSGSRYAQLGTGGKQQLRKIKGVRGLGAISRGKALGRRQFEHER